MFGGNLERKVSPTDETRITDDSSALTGKIGRRPRGEGALGSDIFAGMREALPVRKRKLLDVRMFGQTHKPAVRDTEMLATSICCKAYYTMLPSKLNSSRVPRCLFGRPNSRETIEMLQEALELERKRFKSRWGVDPCEDKENNYPRINERNEQPLRKRNNPYSPRQTNIHGKLHSSFLTEWYLLGERANTRSARLRRANV